MPSQAAKVVKLRGVRVTIDNQPGALARATRLLADAGVNLEAVEVEILGQYGFFRFSSDETDDAVNVLRKNGYIITTDEILEVILPNKPGELARACETLAKGKVNIESCFGSGLVSQKQTVLFFRVDDAGRAARLLEAAGFRASRATR